MSDPLWQELARRAGPELLRGRLLDAGCGHSSLDFLQRLSCRDWTAVTAEPERARSLRQKFPGGQILVGNWQDPQFLQGQHFQVVLADYLLGACERYAYAFQEQLLQRLLQVCRGWLFIIGLEPWPPPANPAQQQLQQLAQLRDATWLLLGRRPHRELPQAWVEERLHEAGYRPSWALRFENRYDQDFVRRELAAVEANLELLDDPGLAQVLRRRSHRLKACPGGCYSWDYLLAVEVNAARLPDSSGCAAKRSPAPTADRPSGE